MKLETKWKRFTSKLFYEVIYDANNNFIIDSKNMLDEDKRQLMIMKEYLFEDGDLYDGESRKRKFKWNLDEQDLTDLVNLSSDSDSDSQHDDNDDDEQNMKKTIRLKSDHMPGK